MKLAVFDLDGTLLNTGDVDRRCYVQSVVEVFGITGASTDWRDYTHVTDSGITREVVERHQGRVPTEDELKRVIGRFVELLEKEFSGNPRAFEAFPGAKSVMLRLPVETDWRIAIATGGWRASAELKLRCAKMPRDGVPMATADDALAREDIIRTAIRRAADRNGVTEFVRIVSIGDGAWDRHTAASLGLPFVGIGSQEKLEAMGAASGVADYEDRERFVALLESAGVPENRG